MTSTAHAEPAASCEASVRAQIAHQRAIEVHVAPAANGDGFVARVSLDDATTRSLTATTCDDLAAAVALIVARTVDDPVEPPPPPRQQPQPAAPPIEPTPEPASAPPAPPATPDAWHLGARLAAVSGIDVVPGVGLANELSFVVERGAGSAEIGGAIWATSSVDVMTEGLDLGRVDVGLYTAVARLGYRLGALPVRVLAVADFGEMTGTAVRTSTGPWFAVGGGVRAWWQAAARLRVVAGVESEVARERVRFVQADGALEYEPGGWSVRGSVGLEVSVW